jgi:acyl-CoA thioester hydrolase
VNSYDASVPVRFSDIDGFGHVNHAKYLTYCEDHRTVMFTQMGEETGSWLLVSGFSVVKLECEYRAPLELADKAVDVRCSIEKLGTTSVILAYELIGHGNVVATLKTTIVLTEGARPRPMSHAERSWFMQFQSENRRNINDHRS